MQADLRQALDLLTAVFKPRTDFAKIAQNALHVIRPKANVQRLTVQLKPFWAIFAEFALRSIAFSCDRPTTAYGLETYKWEKT
jgi:hypothetical protein